LFSFLDQMYSIWAHLY